MLPLHRHQLAYLGDAGWKHLLDRSWDAEARECLSHWAARRLPLVVTRQANSGDSISLGLPAPARWGRRRLTLNASRTELLYFDEFPLADRALPLLPAALRPGWRQLCAGLKALGAPARVYGSFGWQLLSGLDHLRDGSDIDLCLSVTDAEQADAAAVLLQAFPESRVRIDGELVLDDGRAAAWREWQMWRSGRVRHLLLKSIDGSGLVEAPMVQAA